MAFAFTTVLRCTCQNTAGSSWSMSSRKVTRINASPSGVTTAVYLLSERK
jgi:hypothetical protein